ncbi:MAG: hypothetical protein M5U35_06660 [Roseovarius sp.]|nr:hypothetical protein [Roseovarius sp.]
MKRFSSQRELIEECFQCKVLDTYGLSEFGDIAFETPLEGFLTMDDDAFLELKSINGGPKEIVATQLNNLSCPLLKYRTGDVAEDLADNDDMVGFSNLIGLKGRAHDFVRALDGRYLHGQFFTHILVFEKGIERYLIYQDKNCNVKITLVVGHEYSKGSEDVISGAIKSYIGSTIDVEFEYVENIELTSRGKHKWIISEANPMEQEP